MNDVKAMIKVLQSAKKKIAGSTAYHDADEQRGLCLAINLSNLKDYEKTFLYNWIDKMLGNLGCIENWLFHHTGATERLQYPDPRCYDVRCRWIDWMCNELKKPVDRW